MNDYIYIGKYVNTHGIKGEIKLLSDFEYKDKVFIKGMNIYIGDNYKKYTISSYRHHKIFDMLCLEGISNINDIISLKGSSIYIKRNSLNIDKDEYILQDLIGCVVYDNNKEIGIVKDYYMDNGNTLLEVSGNKIFYIPVNSPYIKSIDTNNKKIITKKGSELIL